MSTSVNIVTPRAFVTSLVGKDVSVKLKWGMEYRGILRCADMYLNLQLDKAEEYIDGEFIAHLDELIIRCNNVLSIRKKDEIGEEEKKSDEEEGAVNDS